MARPKVHPDALHSRRMEARFVAALWLGLGIGAAWIGWQQDVFALILAGVVLAAVGAAWPQWAQAWLERRAASGKARCLQCGLRRPPETPFCPDCGWRAPDEEREARGRRSPASPGEKGPPRKP